MSDDARPFPIQRTFSGTSDGDKEGKAWPSKAACSIPWWLAEVAYEEYALRYGRAQSLERIAERGGFGRLELVMLLRREEF